MPSYTSDGKWKPAHEKTYVDYSQSKIKANREKKSFFHDGPDRAAVEQLKEAGQDFFGQDVKTNPDNIMRARQLGMTIDEFLKLNDPPTEAQKKAEEEKANQVIDHSPPTPKRGVQTSGGGVTIRGKFADDNDMPV